MAARRPFKHLKLRVHDAANDGTKAHDLRARADRFDEGWELNGKGALFSTITSPAIAAGWLAAEAARHARHFAINRCDR
jgi:hypothetical protein